MTGVRCEGKSVGSELGKRIRRASKRSNLDFRRKVAAKSTVGDPNIGIIFVALLVERKRVRARKAILV